jgi:hypothetical protein
MVAIRAGAALFEEGEAEPLAETGGLAQHFLGLQDARLELFRSGVFGQHGVAVGVIPDAMAGLAPAPEDTGAVRVVDGLAGCKQECLGLSQGTQQALFALRPQGFGEVLPSGVIHGDSDSRPRLCE